MQINIFVLSMLAACAAAAEVCDSTALLEGPCTTTPAPTLAPTPAPTPAPTTLCDTTAAQSRSPAPTPGCADKLGDWNSSAGSPYADFISKSYFALDVGDANRWNITDGSFDANVPCRGCGGSSTVTGTQAYEGKSYDMAPCAMVPTVLAVAGAIIVKSMTTARTGPDAIANVQPTQGTQETSPTAVTTTTQNSSSRVPCLCIFLGILAFDCLLVGALRRRTAMQGIGLYGAQGFPAMGDGDFGMQMLPGWII